MCGGSQSALPSVSAPGHGSGLDEPDESPMRTR
jgi:hypothetical protein